MLNDALGYIVRDFEGQEKSSDHANFSGWDFSVEGTHPEDVFRPGEAHQQPSKPLFTAESCSIGPHRNLQKDEVMVPQRFRGPEYDHKGDVILETSRLSHCREWTRWTVLALHRDKFALQ